MENEGLHCSWGNFVKCGNYAYAAPSLPRQSFVVPGNPLNTLISRIDGIYCIAAIFAQPCGWWGFTVILLSVPYIMKTIVALHIQIWGCIQQQLMIVVLGFIM